MVDTRTPLRRRVLCSKNTAPGETDIGNSIKRPCAWCGQEFQAQRVTAKFCGGDLPTARQPRWSRHSGAE